MQRLLRRFWLCPSRFSSRKVPNRCPRADFCGGRKKQTQPAPHPRTFNGGESIKTISQPSYLPSTSTADIFLFQRGKVEAGRPLTVPGRPHDKTWNGSPESAAKASLPLSFCSRWTTANSTSKSALRRPSKVLK
jgi:hypothetical protein